jgi:uncharacterized protein (TIGR02757 family)
MIGRKWPDNALQNWLNEKANYYEQPSFIVDDPISVPHRFSKKQDIEIAAFLTAIISWGLRKSIIQNSLRLMQLMDNAPHQFVVYHSDKDLKRFAGYVHRTFNETDLLYFIYFLRQHYRQHESLEDAFVNVQTNTIEQSLIHFHNYFFDSEYAPQRTRKHISTPQRHSACKRINMFLRWMVRSPAKGVDFGLWKKIKPSQLICPLDVHVQRVALELKLLHRKQSDWKAAVELTEALKKLDPEDPVKYDYALFSIGVIEKWHL